jgi:hypothetical protein
MLLANRQAEMKKHYDETWSMRIANDLLAVITYHILKKKPTCEHCIELMSLAMDLHKRNELIRYKNKQWNKGREDRGWL